MIDKLAYLVAVARERSFRRAAESCGVAQPTLSTGIKHLEDELGVMLVRRSSRMQGLTPEGETVLVWAKRLIGDARAMRQDLQGLREGLAGEVRIAVIPTALAAVPALTAACLRRHPQLRFTILSCASAQVMDLLENLEVDAGVTYLNNEGLGRVQRAPLYTERYLLLTADPALFAGRQTIGWSELGTVPLCLLTPDMQNRRIVERLMQAAGVTPSATIESNSQITLLAHVLAGPWATILPEQIARTLALAPRLRGIGIETDPANSHEIGLVVPNRDPLPLLAAALLAEARLLAASAGAA